jgi:uncharacterized protein (DUF2062 family)
MIRRVLKRNKPGAKVLAYLDKHNISREYLSINRKSVSNAVLIGFFIAMIPMPFQMFAVILMTFVMRFNVPLALAIVWITNPVTIPFIYYFEYLTGNLILMREGSLEIELSFTWFQEHISEIFLPLYVGALFYSLLFGFGGYYLIHLLWKQSVHKEKHHKKTTRRLRHKHS